MLLQGRVDLTKIGAERFKLLTSDNNEIDAIFLDRRHKYANDFFNKILELCNSLNFKRNFIIHYYLIFKWVKKRFIKNTLLG